MRGSRSLGCVMGVLGMLLAPGARAQDRAVVTVGADREGYSEPPPERVSAQASPPLEERRGSAVRLSVGPWAATTGRGLGPGLGVGADLGSGTLGARLSAAWLRGEPSGGDASPIAGGLAQYTVEMTADLAARGAIHPVLGLGFGYARVDAGRGVTGALGVGTASLVIEYLLALTDADVRVGLGATGALPGPADGAVADARGWMMIGARLGIGF